MMNDFLHLSITCRDLARSIVFYERLGLIVIKDLGEVNEPGIGTAFGLSAGHLKVIYMAAPEGSSKLFIDLVEWIAPEAPGYAYATANHVGLNRFALRVSQLDTMIGQLKALGVTFVSDEPQSFGDAIRCIVAKDPDGVFVQLIEGIE